MNKFILEQLNKTQINLPPYNNDTTLLVIRKSNTSNYIATDLEVGKVYNICVDDYIINEPDNFSLSANWNSGTKPQTHRMRVLVLKINGKMVQVSAAGLDASWTWSGWLPRKSIHILEQ